MMKLQINKTFIIFCLCFINFYSKAQSKDTLYIDTNRLIQLSGVVVSENELEQLSYTTVYDKTLRRGVLSDYYGYFSMVTYPGDTLIFSFYGYKKSSFIVPDTLIDNRWLSCRSKPTKPKRQISERE